MGNRTIDPRLRKLYDSGTPVYSISRIDTINRCLCEAYNTYIAHLKARDSVYSLLGTRMHDTLEAIVNGKATKEDLLDAMQAELEDVEMVYGLSFPKDRNGGLSIRDNWIADMTHFCNTYEKPDGEFKTEEFFLYKTPKGRYLQGYIDLQKINPGKSVDIFDYKTSTMYVGKDILEHGRQLVVYALGLEQSGIKVDSVSWNFLKYATITFQGKKTAKSKAKTEIVKMIERRKIASELKKYVEADLIEAGYDEFDTEIYLNDFIESNDFFTLPDEVASNYKVEQCIYKYDITDEIKEECIKYIDDTIDRWEAMSGKEEDYPPLEFTSVTKTGKVKTDIFYCTQLCDHFKNCKYIKEFLESLKEEEEDIL